LCKFDTSEPKFGTGIAGFSWECQNELWWLCRSSSRLANYRLEYTFAAGRGTDFSAKKDNSWEGNRRDSLDSAKMENDVPRKLAAWEKVVQWVPVDGEDQPANLPTEEEGDDWVFQRLKVSPMA
jgi:hypothetical protein